MTTSPTPSSAESSDSDNQAWQRVQETLDLADPRWRAEADGGLPLAEQACLVIERMSNAEDDLLDLHHHLRQEMANIRVVLGMEGIPEPAMRELRAHLIRLVRLV